MSSLIKSALDYLSRYNLLNHRPTDQVPEENRSLWDRCKAGFVEGIKNFPRAMMISVAANAVFSYFLPFNGDQMLECMKARTTSRISDEASSGLFSNPISKVAFEELVFRVGIQGYILPKLGIEQKRLFISATLFAIYHLNNLNTECLPKHIALAQACLHFLNPILTVLYEKGGFPLSFSAHLSNNLGVITALFLKKIRS